MPPQSAAATDPRLGLPGRPTNLVFDISVLVDVSLRVDFPSSQYTHTTRVTHRLILSSDLFLPPSEVHDHHCLVMLELKFLRCQLVVRQ